jgi:mannose-6-phosphate isomerase-like protein (cupin superfamily)
MSDSAVTYADVAASGRPQTRNRLAPSLHGERRYVNLKRVDVPPLLGCELPGSDFVVAEWVDNGESSAERPIAPLHRHLEDDEAWYVVEGRLGFVRGDERLEAGVGSAVLVPRGVAHTYWNAGAGRARYVIVMTPRVAALVAALHEPGANSRELFTRFASELLV